MYVDCLFLFLIAITVILGGGGGLFISRTFEGETYLTGGLMMVLILHEELESKVGKLRHKKLDVKQPKNKKTPNFQRVSKPYRISPQSPQSWLINTVYRLRITSKGELLKRQGEEGA